MSVPACILVVTSIHHGNTMKVAEAMSSATGSPVYGPGKEALLLIERGAAPGFGSGIFFGHHHEDLLEFAASLPTVEARPAFVFSTSGTGLRPAELFGRRYHRQLVKLLEGKGFTMAGEFGCKGFDTYGPWGKLGGVARGRPNTEELGQAQAFALAVQDAVQSNGSK